MNQIDYKIRNQVYIRRRIIFPLLIFASIQMQAQVQLNKDSTVTMPLATYRDIRQKFYLCDTLQQTNDEIIARKDSVIMNQKFVIKSMNQTIAFKDSTIRELRTVKLESKPHKDWKLWAGATLGLLLGILLN